MFERTLLRNTDQVLLRDVFLFTGHNGLRLRVAKVSRSTWTQNVVLNELYHGFVVVSC